MSRYQELVDLNCMPMPFGLLCLLEDRLPFRDTDAIHRVCPDDDLCLAYREDCPKRCHQGCVPPQRSHAGRTCPGSDFLCRVHDSMLNLLVIAKLPAFRGTWRR